MIGSNTESDGRADRECSVRAVRGATRVQADEAALIQSATQELLLELLRRNELASDDVVSAIFTVTPDLRSDFPARAARAMGWADTAMLCAVEIAVPGALDRVVRVLLHVEVSPNSPMTHVYLHGAQELRPDLMY